MLIAAAWILAAGTAEAQIPLEGQLQAGDFEQPLSFDTGFYPGDLAVADFNGDGSTDIVTANAINLSETLTVLLGDGRGGFTRAPSTPNLPGDPGAIEAADFNADGTPDLALVLQGVDNTAQLMLGRGDGSFQTAGSAPLRGGSDLTVADLNGDGVPDLTVSDSYRDQVQVLLGNQSGGLSAAPTSPEAVQTFPRESAAADFDGDGKVDLAVADRDSGDVTVLLGTGGGDFGPGVTPIATADNPVTVDADDVTGDGLLDLVLTTEPTPPARGVVEVLRGEGAGGFSPIPVSVADIGYLGGRTAIADFTRDGLPDIAIAAPGDDELRIYRNAGGGVLRELPSSPEDIRNGSQPTEIASGDFNADGKPDLAVPLASAFTGFGGSPSQLDVFLNSPERSCGGRPATIVGRADSGSVNGTDGDDVIVALGVGKSIDARGGDDVICGTDEADRIFAGVGKDIVFAGGGNDDVHGEAGRDRLNGNAGDDRIQGDSGWDRVNGGPGADRCPVGPGKIGPLISCSKRPR